MPNVGDTANRYGRSYVWLQPNTSISNLPASANPGVWRLNTDDDWITSNQSGATVSFDALLDSSVSTIAIGQLVYVTSTGTVALANASAIATAQVAGVATNVASAGQTVTVGTNASVLVPNLSVCVDGATSSSVLSIGSFYYLSSLNSGFWTSTPDTTTPNKVVIPCGVAVSSNRLAVDIETPTVV
tara:strand:+ start:30551 stop:31108 length:558 start_codon:yes stop_codon:yes gene_type:complete